MGKILTTKYKESDMKKYLLLMTVFLFMGFTSLQAQINVTFKVDMSRWQELGKFDPTVDEVKCVGDVSPNSWDPAANTGMTRTGGSGADSSVYSVTYAVNPNNTYAYKYAIGSDWNRDEKDLGGDGNRHLTVGANDTTLATVWFDNISGGFKHVTFNVDMSLPIKSGDVTPGVTNVYVAGNFTAGSDGTWSTYAKSMTKSSTDSTYSYTTVVPDDSVASGDTLRFKFIYSATDAASGSWENVDDRKFFVPEKDSSEFSAYWDDVNPNVTLATGDVNFAVDMSVMIRAGIFDPVKDSVLISAGFNGWTTDAADAWMTQNPINDSSYFITHTFNNQVVGSNYPYKYYVKKVDASGVDTIWNDGYERPVFSMGGNRTVLFNGDASKDTSDYYDGVLPDWFVPSGTGLQVTFTVDMNPAMDADLQGPNVFNPAEDKVYFISEQPTFRRTQEWIANSDTGSYFELSSIGNGLYSGTVTLKEPTFNAFEYIYAWKEADGSWVNEPISFGVASRVRYVGQDAPSSFPQSPWPMPTDTWTNSEQKPNDQEVDPYQSYQDYIDGVKVESTQPGTYSLSQNYPNPFNPTTNIKFSIEQSGLVSLKVYNILGQEVATLLNKELNAGSYEYNFDASKLTSGVYIYTIHSGNFMQTKKMILLK